MDAFIKQTISRLEQQNLQREPNRNVSEVSAKRPEEAIERLRDNFVASTTTASTTEHQRVKVMREIAMSTDKVVKGARAKLMESERSRGSRGE